MLQRCTVISVMNLVSELDLPVFDYSAPDFSADRYHQQLAETRQRGWLAKSPLAYIVLDRDAGEFFLRSRKTAFPGRQLAEFFGVTGGPRLNRWRPFARARAGFLRVGSAPAPIACSLIFPPALSCSLAAGDTLFTADVGGGLEVFTPAKTFVRFDIGDRMLRYPGPARDRANNVHDGTFLDHDLRLVVGAGWRF